MIILEPTREPAHGQSLAVRECPAPPPLDAPIECVWFLTSGRDDRGSFERLAAQADDEARVTLVSRVVRELASRR